MKQSPMPPRKQPMARGGPISRKQGLSPGTSLPPGGALPRHVPLRRTVPPASPGTGPVRKAASRTLAEVLARRLVRERSGGVCEMCGQARATNACHRVGQGQGGLWCPSNLLDGCGSGTTGCHGWCHANPEAARGRGWMLLSTQDPLVEPAVHWQWGRVLLRPDGTVAPVPGPDSVLPSSA